MTFPDPYHDQHWHKFPKHLQSPHLDPHGLHQNTQMIHQNDPWAKPSVKMTFPDAYHEQHWHESSKHLHSHHLDPQSLHQSSHIISQNNPWTEPIVKMTFADPYYENITGIIIRVGHLH